MNTNPEPKPLIGDDGELLKPDRNVDLHEYAEYVEEVSRPPAMVPSERREMRFGTLIMVGLALTSVLFCGGLVYYALRSPENYHYLGLTSSEGRVPLPTPTLMPVVRYPNSISMPEQGEINVWRSTLPTVHRLAWSPDGRYFVLLYGDDQLSFWDFTQARQFQIPRLEPPTFAWLADGVRFAVWDENVISIYAFPTGEVVQTITTELNQSGSEVFWSPDRLTIAVLSDEGKQINLVNAADGKLRYTHPVSTRLFDMAWSPDGQEWIALSKSLILQGLPGSVQSRVLKDTKLWGQAAWSPDGNRIAVTGDKIWGDRNYQASLTVIQANYTDTLWSQPFLTERPRNTWDSPLGVAWSPDGKYIATFAVGDPSVYLWNSADGTLTGRFRLNSQEGVFCMAWSPDGRYLAIRTASFLAIWSPK